MFAGDPFYLFLLSSPYPLPLSVGLLIFSLLFFRSSLSFKEIILLSLVEVVGICFPGLDFFQETLPCSFCLFVCFNVILISLVWLLGVVSQLEMQYTLCIVHITIHMHRLCSYTHHALYMITIPCGVFLQNLCGFSFYI